MEFPAIPEEPTWGDSSNSDGVIHIIDQAPRDNPGYAVLGTAAIASQADSPAPGPADVVAAGIAIYGLYKLATWSPPPFVGPSYWEEIIPRRLPLPLPPLEPIETSGDRDARKVNKKRLEAAKKALEKLQEKLKELRSKPNKTPEDKEEIERVERQIDREKTRIEKSETHGRKGKGS